MGKIANSQAKRLSLLRLVSDSFLDLYHDRPAAVVRAPGRVNLIGEHTDYNDGFVLPMAIDRAVWIALRPRDDRRVVVQSKQRLGEVSFSLEESECQNNGWGAYIHGVAMALRSGGYSVEGWEGVVASNLPIGAGLSSSAALEIATARAFSWRSGLPWDALTMAKLGQRAENEWVGVNCGIMDQIASAAGVAGHALLVDCRSLHTEAVALPDGVSVVVLDTGTRRGLVDSVYNERRATCKEAARILGVRALRDVDPDLFAALEMKLDEVTRRRARHVVSEIARTLEASAAMRLGDARAVGRMMDSSHVSLRDDFEVSSAALDAIVECASEHKVCLGARMTGAGFGGCAIALVEASATHEFTRSVIAAYQTRTGNEGRSYVCHAADGAEVVEDSPLRFRRAKPDSIR